jgi:putative pyruvate formate lyase activating enzyme
MSDQTIGAERLALARQQYRRCLLCEHRCGVDRTNGERGFCAASADARVYRYRVECGEEIELIPSQLLYLSGCNLRCVFCIGEADAFDPQRGQILTGQLLTEVIVASCKHGARNIQWVGGEPTIHLPAILEAMAGCDRLLPVVWKSNFFGTIEGFTLLNDIVDVYVADLKFGNNACARQISGVDGYMQIVTRNLLHVAQGGCDKMGTGSVPTRTNPAEMASGEVPVPILSQPQATRLIVRHLLLPGHIECCYRPMVDWMCRHLPTVPLHIMTGYLPRWQAAGYQDLASPLGREVGAQAIALARDKGLSVIV